MTSKPFCERHQIFSDFLRPNKVGYNTQETTGENLSPLLGACFMPVGAKFYYKDFAPVDGCWSTSYDLLQVINPDSLEADALLVYVDKTTADIVSVESYGEPGHCDDLIGWWDTIDGFQPGEDEDYCYNDKPVVAGAGYMGYFENYSPLSIQLPGALDKLD